MVPVDCAAVSKSIVMALTEQIWLTAFPSLRYVLPWSRLNSFMLRIAAVKQRIAVATGTAPNKASRNLTRCMPLLPHLKVCVSILIEGLRITITSTLHVMRHAFTHYHHGRHA